MGHAIECLGLFQARQQELATRPFQWIVARGRFFLVKIGDGDSRFVLVVDFLQTVIRRSLSRHRLLEVMLGWELLQSQQRGWIRRGLVAGLSKVPMKEHSKSGVIPGFGLVGYSLYYFYETALNN